jgi:hypothetical protein
MQGDRYKGDRERKRGRLGANKQAVPVLALGQARTLQLPEVVVHIKTHLEFSIWKICYEFVRGIENFALMADDEFFRSHWVVERSIERVFQFEDIDALTARRSNVVDQFGCYRIDLNLSIR